MSEVQSEVISTALQKFNIADTAIMELSDRYMVLKTNGLDDKKAFDAVHEARMDVKGRRVEVEKTRKELKEEALKYGRAVDAEAKRITALLAPIEDHLQAEEDKVTNERARIKKEAEEKDAGEFCPEWPKCICKPFCDLSRTSKSRITEQVI